MKTKFDETFKNGCSAKILQARSGAVVVIASNGDHTITLAFESMGKAAPFVSDIKHDHIKIIQTKKES